jgi:hypothetical protein
VKYETKRRRRWSGSFEGYNAGSEQRGDGVLEGGDG